MRLGQFIVVIAGICLFSRADASTVILQTGQKIEGQIIEHTEMTVTLDIQGTPKTFFWGEIASIDGNKGQISHEVAAPQASQEEKKAVLPPPYFGDQQDSLVRFMDKRKPSSVPENKSSDLKSSPTPAKDQLATKAQGDKPLGVDKNVVSTPDGGIIIVGSSKITKYDKDLNVIKEIKLKTDNASG